MASPKENVEAQVHARGRLARSPDAPDPLSENGCYERLRTLGRGSFGYVVLARDVSTQEVVAIKLMPREQATKYVEAEIVNHSLLRHPHIVQFKQAFLTHSYIAIAMEYAGSGTLFNYVREAGCLREAVARWFFQQLVIGVDYCHRKGVVNRDIKLENTLLASMPALPLPLVKICDFGYSKAEHQSAAKSKVGTLSYMAPEVLVSMTRNARYDGKLADVWSCGVMLYVMLFGQYPFDPPGATGGTMTSPGDVILMLERMVSQGYDLFLDAPVSQPCRDLLQHMLAPDPTQRISVSGITVHPWFQSNLPPDALAMNEVYLGAAPLPGVPHPAVLRRLMQEAQLPLGARVVPAELPPPAQAAAAQQLLLAEGGGAAMTQQLLPGAAAAPAVDRLATAAAAAGTSQAAPGSADTVAPLMTPSGAAAVPVQAAAAAVGGGEGPQPMQQQQQQQPPIVPIHHTQGDAAAAAAALEAQGDDAWQHPSRPRLHSSAELAMDVKDGTLHLIDSAISAQLAQGSSGASAQLLAYMGLHTQSAASTAPPDAQQAPMG